MKNKGTIPPITIPNTIFLMCGSKKLAITSATTWERAAPNIPAMYPLEIIFKSLFILHPV